MTESETFDILQIALSPTPYVEITPVLVEVAHHALAQFGFDEARSAALAVAASVTDKVATPAQIRNEILSRRAAARRTERVREIKQLGSDGQRDDLSGRSLLDEFRQACAKRGLNFVEIDNSDN